MGTLEQGRKDPTARSISHLLVEPAQPSAGGRTKKSRQGGVGA